MLMAVIPVVYGIDVKVASGNGGSGESVQYRFDTNIKKRSRYLSYDG